MKKITLAFLILSISGPALAADKLAQSGFNIGLNTGVIFGKSSINLDNWEGYGEGTHKKLILLE